MRLPASSGLCLFLLLVQLVQELEPSSAQLVNGGLTQLHGLLPLTVPVCSSVSALLLESYLAPFFSLGLFTFLSSALELETLFLQVLGHLAALRQIVEGLLKEVIDRAPILRLALGLQATLFGRTGVEDGVG